MRNLDNDAYGEATDARTVRFERLLPGPVERLWAYLTEPEKRARWLASGPMDLRAGGKAPLFFRHSDFADDPIPSRYASMKDGVTSDLTVVDVDPPRLLVLTWPEAGSPSEVTFELFPKGNKVALVVTHRRLPDSAAMANVASGWHAHLMVLEAELEGRKASGFWRKLTTLEDHYGRKFAEG